MSESGQNSPGILVSQRRSILFIYICTFFYWMALYVYVPVLPVYAESMGASLTMVGIIVAAYAIPQFVLRIPIGIWSDFLGRQKPLIMAGAFILILGSVGLALSPNPLYLAISRATVGVGAAMWVVFPVYLVNLYSVEKMGQAVSVINFITGAALVAATVLGGVISDIQGEKLAFFSAAGMAIVAVFSMTFAGERRMVRSPASSWSVLKRVTRRPLLIAVSVVGVLLFFAEFSSVWGFVPIYAAKLGASDIDLGLLTMMVTIGAMAGTLAVSPMMKRWGHIPSLVLSSLMLGLALLAIPFINGLFLLGVVLLIHGLGYGVLSTQLMVLSIYGIEPRQRATAMGFFQAVYAIGMLTGPLVGGLLSDNYGLPVVFYLGGAICLVVVGLAFLPVIPSRRSVQEK
jgi:MFS transporter, DHA1 family, multidrug resistance protein